MQLKELLSESVLEKIAKEHELVHKNNKLHAENSEHENKIHASLKKHGYEHDPILKEYNKKTKHGYDVVTPIQRKGVTTYLHRKIGS